MKKKVIISRAPHNGSISLPTSTTVKISTATWRKKMFSGGANQIYSPPRSGSPGSSARVLQGFPFSHILRKEKIIRILLPIIRPDLSISKSEGGWNILEWPKRQELLPPSRRGNSWKYNICTLYVYTQSESSSGDLPAKHNQTDCLHSKAGVVEEGGHLYLIVTTHCQLSSPLQNSISPFRSQW